jgi:PAS domain S-box-containing protein
MVTVTDKPNRSKQAAELRRQAEEVARGKAAPSSPVGRRFEVPEGVDFQGSSETLAATSLEEAQRMLHELRLHQIELEMQNEELRRVGAELDAARERYFAFYDLSPVGYYTVDEDGLIREANLTAATLLGMARGALVKQPITRFILPVDQDIHYRHRKRLLETDEPQAAELRMVKMGGLPFWVRLEGVIAQVPEGAPVFRFVMSDITERKQATAALQRTSEVLSQSNEEVRQFTYIASHDLRGPLVNFRGFVSELRHSLAELGSLVQPAIDQFTETERASADRILRSEVPDALRFIDTSAIRMGHLINSLLRLSQLGRHEPVPQRLDLRLLVSEILASLGPQIEARGAVVTVLPLPEVTADRISMELILSNILTNAVLYLDPARPGRIEIVGAMTGTDLLVKISDNGRGIAPQEREKVFAPLRRVGAADVPGEGMGLACVQAMIRHQGGRIWFDSEPGVGTTFSFVLPVVHP